MWGSQEHSVPRAQQVKFSPCVVWGGITARGLTNLYIIPQKMNVNSNYYIHEILEKEVKPAFSRTQTSTDLTATKLFSRDGEGMFQQDGARAHTSEATIAWLDANIKHYIPPDDWPPNSPDYGNSHLCRPRASVTASIEAPSPKSMEINFSVNTSKSCQFDA